MSSHPRQAIYQISTVGYISERGDPFCTIVQNAGPFASEATVSSPENITVQVDARMQNTSIMKDLLTPLI